MSDNKILEFGASTPPSNILTDQEYEDSDERTGGVIYGTSNLQLHNKSMKQSSLVASGISDFIASNQATDIDDSFNTSSIFRGILSCYGERKFYYTTTVF